MPLAFVLDEHLRGVLWRTIQRHNTLALAPLDVRRVGDEPDLPLGSLDPQILFWAERENRIWITRDLSTVTGHLANHLQTGHHSPGIFMVRRHLAIRQVVDFLVEAAYRSDPDSWRDRIEFIP